MPPRDGDCYDCGKPYAEKPGNSLAYQSWDGKTKRCSRAEMHVCGQRHGTGLVEPCALTRHECKEKRRDERAHAWQKDPSSVAPDSEQVIVALERFHRGSNRGIGWAMFREYRCGTGYVDHQYRGHRVTGDPDDAGIINPETRIDLYVINLWPSKGVRLIAYEVKVSRADFLSEIRQPDKRAQALKISTEYSFATPQGLVKPDEVPDECGLVEVRYGKRGASYIETVKAAPRRDAPCFHWREFAAMAARAKDGR